MEEYMKTIKQGDIIMCADYSDMIDTQTDLARNGITAEIEPKYNYALHVTKIEEEKE